MKRYRVVPLDENAAPTERGGALFVPPGGGSRIDNPDLYLTLYLVLQPEAAIAEAFGRIPIWTPETFVHASGRPHQLLTYEAPDGVRVFDLDDVEALRRIGIAKPSAVVTRDRTKTQAWARRIFETGSYAGIRWWSYYNPDWTVLGLWNRTELRVSDQAETLTTTHPTVHEAAAAIVRQITV